MFTTLRMVSLRVPDLERAKDWYRCVLDREPAFDAPFAVVFPLGDCALTLLPRESDKAPSDSCVAYLGVDDIETAYCRLVAAGATVRSEIAYTALRSRTASVTDPFGNVLGIMSGAERAKSVESRPSESAMTVALSRALAARDDRDGLHGPDDLAEVFLTEEAKKALVNPSAREWMIGKMGGTHEYFLGRTRYLDEIVVSALGEDVPQLVFLGAGYDTRACRFENATRTTHIFELDVEATQRRKRERLERAGVRTPDRLVYATINFETDSIADVLVAAGLDPHRRTLFIWEGVSSYLTADAVDHTLAAVRRLAAPGSAICFDYLMKAPDMATRYGVKEVFEAWRTAYSGEPVRFGVEEGTIGTFLSERGYHLVEHLTPGDLERRFIRKQDGSSAGRVVALFGLVRAQVGE